MPVSHAVPAPSAEAAGHAARTVGIWLELDAAGLALGADDERVRLARDLAAGLGVLPEVARIVVPCQPGCRPAMAALFADPARPGRPVADSLEIVAAGRDRRLVDVVATWIDGRRRRCLERLCGMHATGSPRSWPAALAHVRHERRGRPRLAPALVRSTLRLVRTTAWLRLLEAAGGLLARLPPPHAGIAADLRRRGVEAVWCVPGAATARRLPGTQVVVAGDPAPASRAVAPAPASAWHDGLDEAVSRRLLARALRDRFGVGSGADGRPHRHFCDFPFERVDYVLAPVHGLPAEDARAVLHAHAHILRRHRRDVQLVLAGRAVAHHVVHDAVCGAGLVFDVAEVDGLPEEARARLVRHARAVVIPPTEAGRLPSLFTEAIALGTPVVMDRRSAARWLTPEEVGAPEYYGGGAGETAVGVALLHALDHREEVVARQRAVRARLAVRSWIDVAREIVTGA